jgi:ribosomal protein S18 acetylase RimI-like enzyme
MLTVVQVHSLGFQTDLMLRRLEGGDVVDLGGYLAVRSPRNPGYWWGNFLLLPAAALAEGPAAWTERFARVFPAARHVALGVDATRGREAKPAGFTEAGFELEQNVVLTAQAGEIHPPRHLSQAAEWRPLHGDDWRQSLGLRNACHEGPGAVEHEFNQRKVADQRAMTEAGHGAWFGAFTGGRLVAQVGVLSDGSGIARYQGVETHPSARRQGLAGTLVYRAAEYAVTALAARTLVIVADPEYAAIRIYRSAGFADREVQISLQRAPDSAPPGGSGQTAHRRARLLGESSSGSAVP